MNRRGFLKGILAAGVAPAFVGSSVLMPVRALLTATPADVAFVQSGPGATEVTWQSALRLYGDGITDDSAAMQAWLDGKKVLGPDGNVLGAVLIGGNYRIAHTIDIHEGQTLKQILETTMIGPVKDNEPMIRYRRTAPLPIHNATFKDLYWRQSS